MYRIVNPSGTPGSGAWFEVYTTIDAALAAAQPDDTIYILRGTYTAPPNGYLINKRLTICGEGMGSSTDPVGMEPPPGTWLAPANTGNGTVFEIQDPGTGTLLQNIRIRDLRIRPIIFTGGTRAQAVIHCTTVGNRNIGPLFFERVLVTGCESTAFLFNGGFGGGTGTILGLHFSDCIADGNHGSGFDIRGTSGTQLVGCGSGGNNDFGIYCEGAGGIRLINTALENNQVNLVGKQQDFDVQLRLKLCHGFTLIGCPLESAGDINDPAALRTFICVETCWSGLIASCEFVNSQSRSGSRGVLVLSGSRTVVVTSCAWGFIEKLVDIRAGDNNTGCMVLDQAMQNFGPGDGALSFPDNDDNGNFAFLPTTPRSNVPLGLLLPAITDAPLADPAAIKQRATVIYHAPTGTLKAYNGANWASVSVHKSVINSQNQTASIAEADLVASPATGVYRVTVLTYITKTGTGNGTLSATVKWKDENGIIQSLATPTVPINALGYKSSEIIFRATNLMNLKYLTTLSSTQGAPKYAVYIRVEPVEA